MRGIAFYLTLAAVIGAGPASAERFEANRISFQNVTGAVNIVTNAGQEIEVKIQQGTTHRTVELALEDGVLVISGEKWREDDGYDCCNTRIRREFHARKDRKVTSGEPVDEGFFEGYPTIVVTMPRKGDVEFVDARVKLAMESLDGALSLDACYVYGEVGNVEEAVIGVIAGSRLIVGDVAAGLEIDVSGDADVMTGNAASVDVDIAGPGDVILGDIDGMLDVSIAGSGLVRASRLDGPLTTRIAGSGAVAVQAGRADSLKAVIDGSGGVLFEGLAINPDLRLFGSSEVRLSQVTGRLHHAGGGEVYVGGELVKD